MAETDAIAGNGMGLTKGLSQEERDKVMKKLYSLLGRTIEQYTMGDSSSVREETAAELFASISFSLHVFLVANVLPTAWLVSGDTIAALRSGQGIIERKTAEAAHLYSAVQHSLPVFKSRALLDTVDGIAGFFRAYDIRFFSHRIPGADIDYQLAVPVPETMLGVEYIGEYLRRLLSENLILSRFDPVVADLLLRSLDTDYGELLINLLDHVAMNAVGRVLLGKAPVHLVMEDAERDKIMKLLLGKSVEEIRYDLVKAAAQLSRDIGITGSAADYFSTVVISSAPRLFTALESGSVDGVFLSF